MTTFARLRDPQEGLAAVECIHNRDLERWIDPSLTYLVMPEDVHEKYDIFYEHGEVLIYSPHFERELGCLWVGQSIDFDYFDDGDLNG